MKQPEDIYRALLPHLVGLYVTTDTDGPTGTLTNGMRRFVLSASVFEYGGNWVLATAGHIVNDLNAILRHGGMLEIRLVDGWSARDTPITPIPLAYDPAWTYSWDDGKLDYGFIFLPNNTRSLLEASGVAPIGPEHHAYEPQDEKYEGCAVLGIPTSSQSAYASSGQVSVDVVPTAVRLEHRFELPPEVRKPDVPLWYGRLPYEQAVALGGMDGMSGGTVFGYWHDQEQAVWFHVIGIEYAVKRHEGWTYVMVTPWYVVHRIFEEYRKHQNNIE